MPVRTGKCINFGLCTIADSKTSVEIPETADFVCPECEKGLSPADSSKKPGRKIPPLAIVAVVLVAIAGVVYYLSSDDHGGGGGSGKIILRLHGSNTIGAQLAPALVEAFLKEQGATDIRVVPGANEESSVQAVLPGESSPKTVEIQAHGSATAFTDLAEKKCDLGMASRKINAKEVSSLAEFGDMTSPSAESVIGLDGIAIIVNAGNPIQALTKEQVAKIFTGEVKSWTQVLSPRGAIRVYARDAKSGTFDTFRTLVLGGGNLAGDAARFEDSRELSDKVAADPDGIGFVGLPYIGSSKAVAISERGVRPLLPTRLTVATEDYLLSRRLFLYAPSSAGGMARKFVAFAVSRAGQDIVNSSGFVAQNVQKEQVQVSADAPSEYTRLTTGADRLSVDFRFKPGSSQLDNKALADLDRVVTFVSDLKYSSQNVMLLGFADSRGNTSANEALSKNRSAVVAEQFATRGLKPATVTGFGSALPVASNDTEEGRQKNRRVEIWIRK
jgi:phosphate transport system substrate-binding protein